MLHLNLLRSCISYIFKFLLLFSWRRKLLANKNSIKFPTKDVLIPYYYWENSHKPILRIDLTKHSAYSLFLHSTHSLISNFAATVTQKLPNAAQVLIPLFFFGWTKKAVPRSVIINGFYSEVSVVVDKCLNCEFILTQTS